VTIGFLGTMGEAVMYSYVGLALYSTIPTWWSPGLVGIMLVIIIVARIIAVFTIYSFTLCPLKCCKSRRPVSFREMGFFSFSGMVRGVIAYALALRIEGCSADASVAASGSSTCLDKH